MDPRQTNLLRITCAPGIGPYLAQELRALGYVPSAEQDTYVDITGTLHDAMRLNLLLRTAYSVLCLIGEFRCDHPDELFSGVSDIAWEDIIPADEYVSVIARGRHPTVNNWNYPALLAKDAMVDRIQSRCGRRPDAGPDRRGVVISVYWLDDRCWVFLNTSGNKLSDRGYRRIPHKAPMQETLAAAVLLAAGYTGEGPLVNPMCGSGTLAIEAGLIAANRAPGLLRSNYSFMHTRLHDEAAWQTVRQEAARQRRKEVRSPIIATDIDPRAVEAARKNATTAGVDHMIDFAVCDFADSPVPPPPGIVLLNPEYGERLGSEKELEKTYKGIGDFLKKRCAGYTGFVFTGNKELAKCIGLRTSRRLVFFNAKIECRLLRYELYQGSAEKASGSMR